MPDYKKLYMKLFAASENAIEILIAAQRECEEMILQEEMPPLRVIELPTRDEK